MGSRWGSLRGRRVKGTSRRFFQNVQKLLEIRKFLVCRGRVHAYGIPRCATVYKKWPKWNHNLTSWKPHGSTETEWFDFQFFLSVFLLVAGSLCCLHIRLPPLDIRPGQPLAPVPAVIRLGTLPPLLTSDGEHWRPVQICWIPWINIWCWSLKYIRFASWRYASYCTAFL